MPRVILFFFLLMTSYASLSQEPDYQSILIPDELRENANAIIRNEVVEVEIKSVKRMRIRTKRVVTVLGEYGNSVARTYDIYDDASKIKEQGLCSKFHGQIVEKQ